MSASIKSLESFLESRMLETHGKMSAPTTDDFTRLFEFEERACQLGAEFFRAFAGVSSRSEADALSPDSLAGFLRVSAYSLCAALAQRKSVSGKGIPKNLTTHLGNAFPSQIKSFGATLRAGLSVKLSERWQKDHCESTETTIELEGDKQFAFRLSWEWRVPDDISDPTEITPLALGDGVVITPSEEGTYGPQQTGFTPRDLGYTPEHLEKQIRLAYARGYADGSSSSPELYGEFLLSALAAAESAESATVAEVAEVAEV